MAKNDYFVIVFRILTYLYQCFMAGEDADVDMFGPDAMRINSGYWCNAMESMSNEGYVTGVVMAPRLGSVQGMKLVNLKITQKGIDYLQENSKMKKVADFLKSAKEIIPGI